MLTPDDAALAAAVDPTAPHPPRRLLRGATQLGHLVGSRVLVGLSVHRPDGSLQDRRQFCGRVLDVADGVVIVEHDGRPVALPADPQAFEPAPPGRYTLAGTGETIVDPDYLTTWNLLARPDDPADS